MSGVFNIDWIERFIIYSLTRRQTLDKEPNEEFMDECQRLSTRDLQSRNAFEFLP
jgi:hypothetical protein